ncbi:MAG: metal-sensing transcriptional repressor [Lachnospiraceae bacterium]
MEERKVECKKECDSCNKKKERTPQERKNMISRLNRIEGQVRGVKSMVEDQRYCVDILTQVSAIQSALNGFSKCLLSDHIKSCVTENIRQGNDEVVDELCNTIQKLMK